MSLTENLQANTVDYSHKQALETPIKEEDEKTACETPVSSPESQSPPTPRKMRRRDQNSESDDQLDLIKQKSSASSCSQDDEEDYSNWPLQNIREPGDNDVLYGRGGGTNHHDGNKRYRKMVEQRKVDYVNSKRLDKPLVALDIIAQWRKQKPPGRFLKFDDKTELWNDVGDKKAREKTSQALREKAPQLRKQQEEQRKEKQMKEVKHVSMEASADLEPVPLLKTTRFDESAKPNRRIKKPSFGREHSLGGDYLVDGPPSIKGFSWEDCDPGPEEDDTEEIPASKSSDTQPWTSGNSSSYEYSAYPEHPASSYRAPRSSPTAYDGPVEQPPAPYAQWQHQQAYYPNDGRGHHYQGSGEYRRHSHHPQWKQDGNYPEYAGHWEGYNYHPSRSHEDNTHKQWASPPHPHRYTHSTPAYPQYPYPTAHESYGNYRSPSSHTSNDPSIPFSPMRNDRLHDKKRDSSDSDVSPSRSIPRPQPIKRDTSHQCETNETKSQVKRMNRQRSVGTRNVEAVSDADVNDLGLHLRQSSIGEVDPVNAVPIQKPPVISEYDRDFTIDQEDIASAIEGFSSPLDRPSALKGHDRGNSLESIGIDVIREFVSNQKFEQI